MLANSIYAARRSDETLDRDESTEGIASRINTRARFCTTEPADFVMLSHPSANADNSPTFSRGFVRFADLALQAMVPEEIEMRTDSILSLQKWEGCVLEVASEFFIARLTDLTEPGTKEDAEIPLSQVPQDDLPLVQPGANFYWNIGRETNSTKRQRTVSELRFQRLPTLTDEDYRQASIEAGITAELLGFNRPCT